MYTLTKTADSISPVISRNGQVLEGIRRVTLKLSSEGEYCLALITENGGKVVNGHTEPITAKLEFKNDLTIETTEKGPQDTKIFFHDNQIGLVQSINYSWKDGEVPSLIMVISAL